MKKNQIGFWFSMDEICARIDELKRQRARGAVIKPHHLTMIDRIAEEMKDITCTYDTVSR